MKVVFDLGGVVFHWNPAQLLRTVLPHRAPDEMHARSWAQALFQGFDPEGDWSQFDLGALEPDALARRMAARTGLSTTEVDAVIEAVVPHLAPMTDTLELIDDLRHDGHRLYYLSNMPRPYADELERRHTFLKNFDDGVFSARLGQIKPHAAIFETARARFGLTDGPPVFIDDAPRNIEAARQLGWQTVLFTSAADTRQALKSLGLLQD